MSVKALYKEIRFTLRDLIYNSRCRKKLLNNDFSLITCDCTGGCVAKDLKVRMVNWKIKFQSIHPKTGT